jgi:pyruvate/2-oxoglutarate dehydrogenase complex dihydrolipoamide dehydrogenase (E3) component
MVHTHDVIVIGAGAAGLTAAGGCALFGLQVALIERGEMGGECLNNGCVPSKALIAAARRAAGSGPGMGVSLAPAQVDWAGVHAHVHGAIAAIAPHDSQERFEGMGCEVIRGHARLLDCSTVEVDGRRLSAPRIVIATGSEPALPDIAGLDSVPYLTNENLFDLGELPGHLVVIGGGAIGMEMGQAFRRLGSQVTIVEAGELMAVDDRESVAVVEQAMRAEGVAFVKGQATRVEGGAGHIAVTLTNGGTNGSTIDCTHLLIATGRKARTEGYGLDMAGVELGRNGILVDDRRRASARGIYAIGDCRIGPRLTHAAGYEGSNVVLEICTGLPAKVDWRALPWCTYTDPEVAQIGMTEAEAREAFGDKITVVREGFDHIDRAVAEGEAAGHMKLVLKGRKVVGASIVGRNAGEQLLPLWQAITGKTGTFALGGAIVAYPTRADMTKALAFKAWEPTVFGPLPKKWAAFVARMRRR